jgi:hypothetical protein
VPTKPKTDWETLWPIVYRRDQETIYSRTPSPWSFIAFWMRRSIVCVAPLLDPSQLGMCSGRSTLDHIKWFLRTGKKADDLEENLVTICEAHHIWSGWATAHRVALRAYLRSLYPLVHPESAL